ncbi:MAG: hypothetical protein ACE5IT_08325 [bacterium]
MGILEQLYETRLGYRFFDGLEKFYEDSRDKRVLTREAIWIVKLEGKGAPQEFIDEEARILGMPIGERAEKWPTLLEENQAYKKPGRNGVMSCPLIYTGR